MLKPLVVILIGFGLALCAPAALATEDAGAGAAARPWMPDAILAQLGRAPRDIDLHAWRAVELAAAVVAQ